MPPANVRHALESALRGSAGPEEWSQICADAALRAGAHSSTIEAMVASFKPDALQQRLDALMPTVDETPEDLMPLPQAARECGVNVVSARRWVQTDILTSYERKPAPGGFTHIVSVAEMRAVRDKDKNKGGRPPKLR